MIAAIALRQAATSIFTLMIFIDRTSMKSVGPPTLIGVCDGHEEPAEALRVDSLPSGGRVYSPAGDEPRSGGVVHRA